MIIDADPRDAGRLVRELTNQGFVFCACRVQTLAELRASLEGGCPDLILSEANICGTDEFCALDMVRECHPDVPFIFVSQTYDPGLIVEVFENGGNGHISKLHLSELREVILQAQGSCFKPPAVEEPSDTAATCTPGNSGYPENCFRSPVPVKPICPRCKRIGNLDGDWQPVEIHLRLYHQATVSLGTCPDCAGAFVGM